MRRLTCLFALVLGLVLVQPAFADKSFVRDDLASDVVRLQASLHKESGNLIQRPAAQLLAEGQAALARGDARRAMTLLGACVGVDDKNAAAWLGYGRAAYAVDPKDGSEKYVLRERAIDAAYASYLHAATVADEAKALALLGQVHADRQQWRPALNAYRASLDRVDDPDIRSTYEDLRKDHGFRIVDYRVDSDSATPRVCFQFSDPLQFGKVDFAPFVAISGDAKPAVTAEDAQLCVDGVKHGERYAIVIRQGLPSSVGETLLKSADYEIYVRDRSPQVRFSGKNYVLPSIGQEGIPVISVNATKINIIINRIGDRSLLATVRGDDFLNQISAYRAGQISDQDGVKVWSGSLDVKPIPNSDVTTAFPVLDAVGKLEAGVYVLTAWPDGAADDDDSSRATQWFVVSDFGLTSFSGTDGVHVLVKSLASAAPIAGVELRLIAKNNEVLDTKTTDSNGYAHFNPGLARGTGGMAPSMVVASNGKGDYGFLDLQLTAFDLTDRGVKGRLVQTALDAFLFTERGVYRSGETVFLTALVRDAKGAVVPGMPVTIVIQRPDGVEYKRVKLDDQGLGGRSLALPLLSDAQHGTWRIQAYADPKADPIGETSFLLEDYVPQKLEVNLTPVDAVLKAGQPARIGVDARFLYGAPGSGLDVTGNVTLEPVDSGTLPGLEGYSVGLQDEPFENQSNALEDTSTTDSKGHVDVVVPLDDVVAPRPLEAKITLTVAEPGGRSLDRTVVLPIRPSHPVIGVKKLFSDDLLVENTSAKFELVAADVNGARSAEKGVDWTLSEVHKTYQWFRRDGSWQFEAVTTTRKVGDGRVDIAANTPAQIEVPVKYGSYRVDVRSANGSAQTAVSFYAGWGGGATADTPDTLEVTLDKHDYNTGDTAKLHFAAKFAGTATIAVVSDGVYDLKTIDIKSGDNDVEMPIRSNWGAGAYMVTLVHRPLDTAAKRLPGRALGVAWFGIDPASHALGLELTPPDKARPRGAFDIPVKLTGLDPGEEAYVTVAAVDVGILNLTDYQLPKPGEYFFGQRQMGAEIRDLYGFLIDGMQGQTGAIRSGGDSGGGLKADTPTQPPLARYSGVVRVGSNGTATISFDLPSFNGTVRVMAAAWSKTKVAHASKDVIVRDPVVAEATLPRFLNLGDQTRFNIDVNNVEAPAGDFAIDVDVHGPLVLPATATHATLRLGEHERKSIQIPVTAAGIGTGVLDVKLSGAPGTFVQTLAVKIEPGRPEVYRRIVRPMPQDASLTVSKDLLAEFLPGTGSVGVSVAPLVAIDVAALLQALDRYPYGCTEQTVSRALPLLYVNQLAATEKLGLDPDIDGRIKTSIERVLSRQSSNGSFGLWSQESSDDIWLDAFTTDFLTRARERNFDVPQIAFQSALDRLRNFVVNHADLKSEDANGFAYAAYVLARNHRPIIGDLRYAADTKLDAFESPFARAQIAAALALLGDRGRSQAAFTSALDQLRHVKDSGLSRPDYGSRLRDGAGTLALAAESGLPQEQLVKASMVLDDARNARLYTSTQENTWMVLAAQALAATSKELTVKVNGEERKGTFNARYTDEALQAESLTVQNTSDLPAQSVLTVSGNPLAQDPAADQGYAIERQYYKLDGSKADFSKVKQNDRLVVVLKITEPEAKYARLLIVDPLPAGLEIDNPKLMDSDSIAAFDWLKQDVTPSTAEYRDDRFVVAADRSSGQPAFFNFAYMVRAVTPGHFVHPPATVEDMYRPERYGRGAFGTFDVAPK